MHKDFYDKPTTEIDVEDIQKYLNYLYTVRKNSSTVPCDAYRKITSHSFGILVLSYIS